MLFYMAGYFRGFNKKVRKKKYVIVSIIAQ